MKSRTGIPNRIRHVPDRSFDPFTSFVYREINHCTQCIPRTVSFQKAKTIQVDLAVGSRALANDRQRTLHQALAPKCAGVRGYVLHESMREVIDVFPSAPFSTEECQHP